MEIAAIGRSELLYNSIVHLVDFGIKVKVIVTAPASDYYKKKEEDFKILAQKIGAKFYFKKRLTSIAEELKGLDAAISVNWIKIITQKQIDLFKLGILNAHFGDLPRYRGNACPNWAIINGEKKVAVSIHLMEGGKLDCGRVIEQEYMSLTPDIYIGDIYSWGEKVIPDLFYRALMKLQKDKNYTLKYADNDDPMSFRCYPRLPEDGKIDWRESSENIQRLIRASSRPLAGAYSYLNGEKIIIWRAELYNDGERYCAVPGQICEIGKDYFVVITGSGKLKVAEWECPIKINSIRMRLK